MGINMVFIIYLLIIFSSVILKMRLFDDVSKDNDLLNIYLMSGALNSIASIIYLVYTLGTYKNISILGLSLLILVYVILYNTKYNKVLVAILVLILDIIILVLVGSVIYIIV